MPNVLNAAQAAEFNDKGFTYARGAGGPHHPARPP